jgi:hypothetical protein
MYNVLFSKPAQHTFRNRPMDARNVLQGTYEEISACKFPLSGLFDASFHKVKGCVLVRERCMSRVVSLEELCMGFSCFVSFFSAFSSFREFSGRLHFHCFFLRNAFSDKNCSVH